MYHHRVVVAVDVCVDSVETFEDLTEETREGLGERDACRYGPVSDGSQTMEPTLETRTDTAREHLLIVDIALHPTHKVLDIFGGRHLSWPLKVLGVLPEVLESGGPVSLDGG